MIGTFLAGAEQQKIAISTMNIRITAVIKIQMLSNKKKATLSEARGIATIPVVTSKETARIEKTLRMNPSRTLSRIGENS